MRPKVSVIIPAYNTEKYIGQAIESALRQTEQDIEVIVVDDASADATVEVVKRFSDDRLKLIVNERSHGVSYARNLALQEARGEWIALLDSDDWYAPKRLERLLEVADTENADLVADDLYFIQDGADRSWGTLLSVGGVVFNEPRLIDSVAFTESNSNMPGSRQLNLGLTKVLARRSFLVQHGLKYNEALRTSEDFHFYLTCLLKGARFIIFPEPYYFYRTTRQGSLVNQSSKLERLDQLRKANLELLRQESVKTNPELVRSLSRLLSALEQSIDYYRVVQPIKEKGLITALPEIVRKPYFLFRFMVQIPKFLYRRTRRYVGTQRD